MPPRQTSRKEVTRRRDLRLASDVDTRAPVWATGVSIQWHVEGGKEFVDYGFDDDTEPSEFGHHFSVDEIRSTGKIPSRPKRRAVARQ